jgi:hypothetical protein
MSASMPNANLFYTDELLMALFVGLGPRAGLAPTRAILKWCGPQSLVIARSILEFFDNKGRHICCRDNAFGLIHGSRIEPLYSQWITDEEPRPREAVIHRWQLNDRTVTASIELPESAWPELTVSYLPLMLPVAHDKHLVASLVNLDDQPIDIARGVQEAVCYVDGVAWRSAVGRVWNGSYLVYPRHATTRSFRIADFPGMPAQGAHELALEFLGRKSALQTVNWIGTGWSPTDTQAKAP